MKKPVAAFLCALLVQSVFAQLKVVDLTVENLVAPVGLGTTQPRLSWKIISDKRDFHQTEYEIQVSTTKDPSKGDAWKTGKVLSGESVYVTYQGTELKSSTHYFWRVRVWDGSGTASPWSERAWWTTGLLHASDLPVRCSENHSK